MSEKFKEFALTLAVCVLASLAVNVGFQMMVLFQKPVSATPYDVSFQTHQIGTASTTGETPYLISLQGVATDIDENPLSTGDITVRIYNDTTGGTLVYEETFADAIEKGTFDVLLGSTIPLNLDYSKMYYTEIDVNGEEVVGDATQGRRAFWPSGGQIPQTSQNFVKSYSVNLPLTGVSGIGSANIGGPLNITTGSGKLLIIFQGISYMYGRTTGWDGPYVVYQVLLDGSEVGMIREWHPPHHIHSGWEQDQYLIVPIIITRLVDVTAGVHLIQARMTTADGSDYVACENGVLIVCEVAT